LTESASHTESKQLKVNTMRTKTLVLTALGALSASGLMAQTNVYSLNAVGYINVTIPAGYSIIADQLWSSAGSNTLATVLPVPADGSQDNDQVLKFNGSGYNTYQMDSLDLPANGGTGDGWDGNGNVTLNPGEAAFFKNIYSSAYTVTFVGTVPQGTNTVALNLGYNLVSSPVPQAGGVSTVLGLTIPGDDSEDNDTLLTYTGGNYQTYNADALGANGWDGTEPTVAVGQGFFFRVISGNAPFAWTRVFSVNQ
jgi:hypothetical protein